MAPQRLVNGSTKEADFITCCDVKHGWGAGLGLRDGRGRQGIVAEVSLTPTQLEHLFGGDEGCLYCLGGVILAGDLSPFGLPSGYAKPQVRCPLHRQGFSSGR